VRPTQFQTTAAVVALARFWFRGPGWADNVRGRLSPLGRSGQQDRRYRLTTLADLIQDAPNSHCDADGSPLRP
jgi:hypothetical protein